MPGIRRCGVTVCVCVQARMSVCVSELVPKQTVRCKFIRGLLSDLMSQRSPSQLQPSEFKSPAVMLFVFQILHVSSVPTAVSLGFHSEVQAPNTKTGSETDSQGSKTEACLEFERLVDCGLRRLVEQTETMFTRGDGRRVERSRAQIDLVENTKQ